MLCRNMLVLTLGGLLTGCLTADQITQCCVLGWPYAMRVGCLAKDICKLRQQQLHEQEQQRRQAQRMSAGLRQQRLGKSHA